MTLLSNVTFGDIKTTSYTTTFATSITETMTKTFDNDIDYLASIFNRLNGDSIIYEFPNQNTDLDFKLDVANGPNTGIAATNYSINYINNIDSVGDHNSNINWNINSSIQLTINSTIVATRTLIFGQNLSTYKIRLVVNGSYRFTCYVRNYHVVKQLPVGTTITGITGFDPNITTYTATSTLTTLSSLPAGWVQSLTTNCTEQSTMCDSTLTITNGGTTIVFNRPVNLTSINDIKNIENIETQLTLYPNPTTDVINFNSNSEISKISVFSLDGQLMASNAKETSINVSNLSHGYYIVHIELDNTIVTKKFLKFRE